MFEKIPRNNIPEIIVDEIQQSLLRGDFKPGEQLPSERALAQMFSVSRSSVREAMKALQYMGLVEIKVGEGCFVRDPAHALADSFRYACLLRKFSVRESIEAREILEAETARLAAVRATDRDKEKIVEVFEAGLMCKGDFDCFLQKDFDLHMSVAEATHNGMLVQMIQTIKGTLSEYSHDVLTWPGQVDVTIGCHRKIVQAILDGDPEQAMDRMIYHLENTKETANMVLASRLGDDVNSSGEEDDEDRQG